MPDAFLVTRGQCAAGPVSTLLTIKIHFHRAVNQPKVLGVKLPGY